MADQSDMQYGVFPVVPRANETDQPKWTDEELDALPYEFKPSDDKAKSKDDKSDEDKKEEGDKTDGKAATPATKPTGSAPVSGQPELPKA